jgi:hypothetical protein
MTTTSNLRFPLNRVLLIILSIVHIASSEQNGTGAVPPDGEDLLAKGELKAEVSPQNETTSQSANPDQDKESPESMVPPPTHDYGTILGGGSSCTFCDTEDQFDPDLEFAGIPCDQWAFLSVFAPPGDECTLLRAAAVKFCGCPTPVEKTCQLCPHGYDGFLPDQSILFVQDVHCQDLVGFGSVDGDTTCDFVERFAYTCGCPGVIPGCSLCGQNSAGENLQMTRPDEVLVKGDNSPFTGDTTCSDWDKMLSIDPESNPLTSVAQGRSSMTSCQQSIHMSEERTGLQLAGLCGCPGVEPANKCSPCSEGFELQTGKEDCDHLTFMIPFVTDITRCAFLQERAIVVGCCAPSEFDFETFQPTLPPNDELPSDSDRPPNDAPNNLPQGSEDTEHSTATSMEVLLGTVVASFVALVL